jgi:glycosyltransferase involved in cell wall biosynthesis
MNNQPQKITFFLASLEGGGIQKATMRLIQEFIKKNIQVALVAVNAHGHVRNEIPEGCSVIDLKRVKTRYAFFRLIRYLLGEKPLITISSQTHLNFLIIVARLLTGYPKHLIVREHITFNTEIAADKKIQERLRPWMIRLFYPLASRFVTVSADSAKSIHKYAGYKKEIRVIQNGLNINSIHSMSNQPSMHPWLNGSKNVKLIIGMGRLSLQKNFSDLLKAFSLLKNKQDYRLIILGEGPELEKLMQASRDLHIQDYVDFPGFVENPYSILARADVFVLSSKWEGFANVIIEALACGVPIVATNCPGGPSDILENKSFAKIVPMSDPSAMSNAIEEMITVRKNKEEIIELARMYDIQEIAQQYIDLINELE